ncbi:MAG: DNA primase [Deltaproteobacteria bacterium]|nr:DNA primase [Deltaproteobacteria bacterium]
MPQTDSVKSNSVKTRDYSLLLDRIKKSPFDDKGMAFIRQCAADNQVGEQLAEKDLYSLIVITQQHGLIDQSLALLNWMNENRPAFKSAWKLHLETLQMLGRGEEFVRLRARAGVHFNSDTLASWLTPEQEVAGAVEGQRNSVEEPFLAMRRDEENISLFMRLFRGRDDAFARQWSDRDREKQGYVPVRHSLMPADISDHLAGRKTYGIYLLNSDSQVYTGVIDVDLKKSLRDPVQYKKNKNSIRRESLYLHQRIDELAKQHNVTCIAEVSGGKGYHFWFPIKEPVDAGIMRRALLQLSAGLGEDISCFNLEIFPKQDRISGKGFGNLVKLPMGIHRGSGKPSWLVRATDREQSSQFEYLHTLTPAIPAALEKLAGNRKTGRVIVHPRHARWAGEFPELATLDARCSMLGQIMATIRTGRTLSVREEKILMGTLAHLPRGRLLLHHLCSGLPEYNRPLLDYRISRVRGTVLGCKRIHSLLEEHVADLPCRFEIKDDGYPHPLRHIDDFIDSEPKSEKVENMKDALSCLQVAIKQVERFM